MSLQHTEIWLLKVSLPDNDVIEDDHVLRDKGSDGNERDKQHGQHVDQLSRIILSYIP